MTDYDSLSIGQKRKVCKMVKKVHLETKDKKGISGSITEATYRHCQSWPSWPINLVCLVEAFVAKIRDGELTLGDFDQP